MDSEKNPYRPGAGIPPVTFAGRDTELEESKLVIRSLLHGNIQRSFFFYGLRGVGKTVLLNEIQKYTASNKIVFKHVEISEHDNFKKVSAETLRTVLYEINTLEAGKELVKKALGILKAFSVTVKEIEFKIDVDAITGKADSGNFQSDLTDLFESTGEAAKSAGKQIVLFFDEVQYLSEQDFEALIGSIHRVYQLGNPLIVFGAGLPQILRLAGDAKSYSERLFEFKPLGYLDYKNACSAISGPTKETLTYSEACLKEIYKITGGYTYFIQEIGKHIWDDATGNAVTLDLISQVIPKFQSSLDNSFFKVRYDRSTSAEKRFMHAMASLSTSLCRTASIARKLRCKPASLGPLRAGLISKGFIYSPEYGAIAFTVPHFDKYIKRLESKRTSENRLRARKKNELKR
jgi:predicted AAA+ superfamily ATPase